MICILCVFFVTSRRLAPYELLRSPFCGSSRQLLGADHLALQADTTHLAGRSFCRHYSAMTKQSPGRPAPWWMLKAEFACSPLYKCFCTMGTSLNDMLPDALGKHVHRQYIHSGRQIRDIIAM
jgi:hypothetical protein